MPSKSDSKWLFGAAGLGNWHWSTSISLLRPTSLQRMSSNGKGFSYKHDMVEECDVAGFFSSRLSRFSPCFSVVTKTTDKSLSCNSHPEKGLCRWSPEEIWWWCWATKSFDIVHVFCLGVHLPWLRMRFLVVRCFELSSEFPRLLTQTPPAHPSTKVWLMKLLLVSVLYLHLAGSTATQEADECADSPSLLSVKDVKGWKASSVEMESVNMSMEEACQKDGSCTDEWACQKRKFRIQLFAIWCGDASLCWHHTLRANRSTNTVR